MNTWSSANAECLVFTFKEGILAAVAHDLKIKVGRFTVEERDGRLEARFDARSLTVVSAMKDGEEKSLLGASDRQKIERTIASDVLSAARYPEIVFSSSLPLADIRDGVLDGTLSLHGVTRSVRVTVKGRVAEAEIHQPDFGMKPYSAMLGTLKLKPRVLVRVKLPG